MTISHVVTVDPATGQPLREYAAFATEQIEAALSATYGAQNKWAQLSIDTRCDHLRAVAVTLRVQREPLAALIVAEMGKPIVEALAEVEKCAWVCEYYADNGPTVLADQEVVTDAKRSWIAHEPMGVVLAVMPWNFPFWQVIRFAAPTLAAGNTCLLKHSPNVTGCALAIEKVFIDSGVPENVFRVLVVAEGDVPAVTKSLITDRRVAAVTLTGSERAGAAVAAIAGGAVKKSLLELGGSDPFVVLADADIDTALTGAVRSRFLNSGQSCLAAKRFIVHRDLVDEFVDRLAEVVDKLIVSDPNLPGSQIGPLARADLVTALDRQVRASVAAGAVVRAGGNRLDRNGSWYAPTVLANATLDMPIMTEETFGPVAAVIGVSSDEEAIDVANATPYGLGASVWSRDIDHAMAVGRRITSGALFINAVVASDPRLPFGGTKHSGYGRELGTAGALEFTNTRTYFIGAGAISSGSPTE